jgi:sugar phosphate isomerase/epimerase
MKFGTLQNVLGADLRDVFGMAAQLGFDGVELDWHELEQIHGGTLSPEDRPRWLGLAHENGVTISGVAAHFLNGGGLASADEKHQEQALWAIREGLQLCRDLKAEALLVPFFGSAEIESEDDKSRLIQHLKTLAPDAETAGVIIAIEHTLRGDEAAQLLNEVNSSFVGNYWDMANCMSLGFDPLEEIQMLGKHITRVHAKEFERAKIVAPRKPGSYSGLNTVPFGKGDVPTREVLSALKSAGYTGWITLETGAFGDKQQAAKEALEVLKNSSQDSESRSQ